MNKKIQLSILSIFVAAALIGSVVTVSDNTVFATKKHKTSNDAEQAIEQDESTGQSSTCLSENNTAISCNNVALSFNLNDGNNALGQR